MKEHITVEELEKASRNVQRLSEFIGERRAWTLASDAGDAASKVIGAAQSLTVVIAELPGGNPSEEIEVRQPPKIEPAARVNSVRLAKFADFMQQLKKWFSAHDGAELPDGSEESVRVIRVSLASTIESINQLCGPATTTEPTSEPLVSDDLGPVAEVDMTARLTLEDTFQKPLLQVYQGVTELTPEAMSRVDEFFDVRSSQRTAALPGYCD